MIIEGTKIRLRDISEHDFATYRYWQQPGHAWQDLDGPYYPKSTQEEIEKLIEAFKERIATEDWPEIRTHLMIAHPHTNKLLGFVSRYWISQETNWAALGIVLFDPASWRKGLGYEALGLWMDYLFSQFPEWVRLDLRTWSGNQGIIRLAYKLGYQQEACFRKARIVEGDYYDGLGFGILREEWNSRFPDGFAASLSNTSKML